MVSDVTRMGEWSPETRSCRWLDGATGPAVGARFRGVNAHRLRVWPTWCTVTEADPGRRFSFDVVFGPIRISHWSYTFEQDGGTTRVTEAWTDRRPGWMDPVGKVAMGVPDRHEHNRAGMEQTLARLKAKAEQAAAA
jgi:hypothetical protein